MKEVVLIETGIANVASITAALRRLDCRVTLSNSKNGREEAAMIAEADYVVLPGVGTFSAGMRVLRARGVDLALLERIHANRPLLAICLGLQLLFEASEESLGERGLAAFPGIIKRLPTKLPLPHLSWAEVAARSGFSEIQANWAYFAHSFAVPSPPAGSEYLVANYGGEFVAGFRIKNILALQFHPELSGKFGQQLLEGWIK